MAERAQSLSQLDFHTESLCPACTGTCGPPNYTRSSQHQVHVPIRLKAQPRTESPFAFFLVGRVESKEKIVRAQSVFSLQERTTQEQSSEHQEVHDEYAQKRLGCQLTTSKMIGTATTRCCMQIDADMPD